jgi:hypothetical protein
MADTGDGRDFDLTQAELDAEAKFEAAARCERVAGAASG